MDTARVAYALEAERKELFRHMIHDEVDKWIHELLVGFDKDCQSALMELSDTIRSLKIINEQIRPSINFF